MESLPNDYVRNLYRAFLALIIILSLFFAVKLMSEWRSYGMMGSGGSNTITVSGHGEVQAVPDIANIYFTIRKEGSTVKVAQDAVAVIEKSALDFLKESNIEEKDIRTENASFSPKYDYQYLSPGFPDRRTPRIIGYEAYESISVKVRNTDDAGKIIAGLGSLGVTDLSGPNFSVDDEDELKATARREAIEEARTKAEVLAKDLGVRLGRVATFNESGNYPIFYGKAESAAMDSVGGAAPAQLPEGEQTITSDVTITYEIR